MTLRLPDCSKCGASIRSRDDETCRYCGALLPWDLWDEISARRIELVEYDTQTFEAAIYQVERSLALAGKKLRTKRERLRLRPPRPDPDRDGEEVDMATGLAIVVGTWVLAVVLGIVFGPMASILGFCASLAGYAWYRITHSMKEASRLERKRKRYRAGGHRQHFSAGVLEVGPPEFHGEGEERTRTRTVYMLDARGNERIAVAPPEFDIATGDVGIATLRGVHLVGFERHRRLDV